MEYEILDECDDALFDASTNPSLHPARERALSSWRPEAPVDERLKTQCALLIPEEEHQLG